MRKPLIPLYIACKEFGFVCVERPVFTEPQKCQWCGQDIKGKRRKSFCCKEHSDEFHRLVTWGRTRSAYSNQIVWRDNLTCQDCGEFLAIKNRYGIYIPLENGAQVHHIVPVEYGGEDAPENLVCLCKICHKKRHIKLNTLYDKSKKKEEIGQNMKKFTILVDMDDTIENLCEVWVNDLSKKYNKSVTYKDITDWDLGKFFPDLSDDELYSPFLSPEFWTRVKPFKDAQYYLKKLIDDGHSVFIVTASHYSTLENKLELVLFKHFPYFSYKDVIVCSKKQLIKGDFLVDDGVHNVVGGDYKGILMNAPHNENSDCESQGIKRVHNWGQVYNIINAAALEEV